MARISYDEQTAAAFKAVREVPRDGLSEWREAVRRHLRPWQGMTLVDIGAGTGIKPSIQLEEGSCFQVNIGIMNNVFQVNVLTLQRVRPYAA